MDIRNTISELLHRLADAIGTGEEGESKVWQCKTVQIPEHKIVVELDKNTFEDFAEFYSFNKYELPDRVIIFTKGEEIFWCRK